MVDMSVLNPEHTEEACYVAVGLVDAKLLQGLIQVT